MAVDPALKEKQGFPRISQLESLLRRIAKVPHSSKPPYQPGHDLYPLVEETCAWLRKNRIGMEEDPTSELGKHVMKAIINAALGAINGNGGIAGCMNVLDTLYQFMWHLNENQTTEQGTKRSHFVTAYSQLGILFATQLLEDLLESISDYAHKAGREELLYIQVLLRGWKYKPGVLDEAVIDELMGTLPPLSPGMMKEADALARRGRELVKSPQSISSKQPLGPDQTVAPSTASLQEHCLPSYLLMGPMRGERLRFHISMNKSADEWKRRGEWRRRRGQEEPRPKLEQGGWYKQLNDKMEAIPDYSSWGANGWELLPPMKPSYPSINEQQVGLDLESSSQDVDDTPPSEGSKKLQLEPPDHHNHFNNMSPPPSQSATSFQSPLPMHLRREGYENALNPTTRLGQSSRQQQQHNSRVYSKGYKCEDNITSPAVPSGGHEPAKRAKFKHREYSSINSSSSSLNDTMRPHF